MCARVSPVVYSWTDLADDRWPGLLLGNGASIAVSKRFSYASLFETAIEHSLLTPQARKLFRELETTNFEHSLSILKTAGLVDEALDCDACDHASVYDNIQTALYESVRRNHVAWSDVTEFQLDAMRIALRSHQYVFTTNYDLLAYWCVMREPRGEGFVDFFWGSASLEFDVRDAEVWTGDRTRLFYLHGGIHLQRLTHGGTRKRANDGTKLLDSFSTDYSGDASPLLISEGNSSDKERSIATSDYLSFAQRQLAQYRDRIVIFGHSLSQNDAHIQTALNKGTNPFSPRDVAVAVVEPFHRSTLEHFENVLYPANVRFFDASTHPLGLLA